MIQISKVRDRSHGDNRGRGEAERGRSGGWEMTGKTSPRGNKAQECENELCGKSIRAEEPQSPRLRTRGCLLCGGQSQEAMARAGEEWVLEGRMGRRVTDQGRVNWQRSLSATVDVLLSSWQKGSYCAALREEQCNLASILPGSLWLLRRN